MGFWKTTISHSAVQLDAGICIRHIFDFYVLYSLRLLSSRIEVFYSVFLFLTLRMRTCWKIRYCYRWNLQTIGVREITGSAHGFHCSHSAGRLRKLKWQIILMYAKENMECFDWNELAFREAINIHLILFKSPTDFWRTHHSGLSASRSKCPNEFCQIIWYLL